MTCVHCGMCGVHGFVLKIHHFGGKQEVWNWWAIDSTATANR